MFRFELLDNTPKQYTWSLKWSLKFADGSGPKLLMDQRAEVNQRL